MYLLVRVLMTMSLDIKSVTDGTTDTKAKQCLYPQPRRESRKKTEDSSSLFLGNRKTQIFI